MNVRPHIQETMDQVKPDGEEKPAMCCEESVASIMIAASKEQYVFSPHTLVEQGETAEGEGSLTQNHQSCVEDEKIAEWVKTCAIDQEELEKGHVTTMDDTQSIVLMMDTEGQELSACYVQNSLYDGKNKEVDVAFDRDLQAPIYQASTDDAVQASAGHAQSSLGQMKTEDWMEANAESGQGSLFQVKNETEYTCPTVHMIITEEELFACSPQNPVSQGKTGDGEVMYSNNSWESVGEVVQASSRDPKVSLDLGKTVDMPGTYAMEPVIQLQVLLENGQEMTAVVCRNNTVFMMEAEGNQPLNMGLQGFQNQAHLKDGVEAFTMDFQTTMNNARSEEWTTGHQQYAAVKAAMEEWEKQSVTNSEVQVKLELEEDAVTDCEYAPAHMKITEEEGLSSYVQQNLAEKVQIEKEKIFVFGQQGLVGHVAMEDGNVPSDGDHNDSIMEEETEQAEEGCVADMQRSTTQIKVEDEGASCVSHCQEMEYENEPSAWHLEEYMVYVDLEEANESSVRDHQDYTLKVKGNKTTINRSHQKLEIVTEKRASHNISPIEVKTEAPHGPQYEETILSGENGLSSLCILSARIEEGPYVCVECGQSFNKEAKLHQHQELHTGENPDSDSEDDGSVDDLPPVITQQNLSLIGEQYVCANCGRTFSQKAELTKHYTVHTEKLYTRYRKSCQNKQGNLFECNICGNHFKKKMEVVKHLQMHLNEKWHECDQCERRFRRKALLTAHLKTHLKDNMRYTCYVCGKGFNQQHELTAHQLSHAGENPYLCNECGDSFGDVQTFIAHHKMHPLQKPYACTECDKRFTTSSSLSSHQQAHLKKKRYTCTECGKYFTSASQLNAHQKTHKTSCSCPHCGKTFRVARFLVSHLKKHKEKRLFTCEECGKTFSDFQQLSQHQDEHMVFDTEEEEEEEEEEEAEEEAEDHVEPLTHQEELYICHKCGECYTTFDSLMRHLKTYESE